jgi:hypothetical protein
MSEGSTTYNAVELTRGLSEARTLDETLAYYGPDSVYDMSQMGMGVFHGREAIREFLEDWDSQYEEYDDEIGLNHDVAFLAVRQNARPWAVQPTFG